MDGREEPDAHEFLASEPVAPPPGLTAMRPDAHAAGILDFLGEAVLLLDAQGRISYLNRAARDRHPLLRLGRGPADRGPELAFLHADGETPVPPPETPMARVMAGELVAPTEYVVVGPGQARRTVVVGGGPFLERGRVAGGVIVIDDYEECRQMAQAVRETSSWLDALVRHIPAIVVVSNAHQHILFTNIAMGGRTPEAYLGTPLWTYVAPEDRATAARTREAVWRTGEPARFEARADFGAGPRDYDVSLGPITEDGRVVALVSVAVDVTARREAQAHGRAQEALLAEAEAIAAIGSFSYELDTARLFWSPGVYRLLGLPPGTRPTVEAYIACIDPAHRAAAEAEIRRIIASPRPFQLEHHVVRADGEPRVFRLRGRPQPDADGALCLIGVLQDVTEQHQAERAKDEFVAIVSHELRTPLTTIRAPLKMLQMGMLDPKDPAGQGILEIAVQSAERMTRLVSDIFDYDRLETGRLTLRLAPVDAADLAAQAADALRDEAVRHGVALEVAAASVMVHADRDRLVQVLTNLLDNALKFSPEGGVVRLEVAAAAGSARLTVRDQGPGIPAEHLEAIFERFRQLDTSSTRRARGTGLGLAIARGIVEQHGGRLWAESEPGKGSAFTFTLPEASPGMGASSGMNPS